MRAPSAGFLLKQIAARRMQADATRVADLNDAERAAVVQALEQVSPRARIDVRLLVDTVTTAHRARVEAEAERMRQNSPLKALQYQLSLVSQGRLAELRRHLKAAEARGEKTVDFGPGSAAGAIMSRLDNIAARMSPPATVRAAHLSDGIDLDDETGGDEPEVQPRRGRGIPRVRSRRSQQLGQSNEPTAPATRPASPNRQNTPATRAPAPFFTGRAFGPHGDSDRPLGCPVGVDYANWRNPKRPAWLIESGDIDEKENEACLRK